MIFPATTVKTFGTDKIMPLYKKRKKKKKGREIHEHSKSISKYYKEHKMSKTSVNKVLLNSVTDMQTRHMYWYVCLFLVREVMAPAERHRALIERN